MTCSPFFKCQSTCYTEKSGMVQPSDPVNSQDRWVWALKTPYCSTEYTRTSVSNCDHIMGVSCVFWILTFSKPLEPLLGPIKFTAKRCNFFVVPQDGSPSRSGFPELDYGWLTLVVPLYKGPIKVEASYLGGWARHKPCIPVIQF